MKMNKTISIFAALVLAVSLFSATAVLAQGPPNNRVDNGEAPNGDEYVPDEEDYVPDINTTEGRGRGIGERVRSIVGEKVEEIHALINGENVSGEEIAGLAQEIGVQVENVVRVEVRNIKNQTRQRIEEEQNPSEKMRMHTQQAKASRYDYAYDNFVTEGREKINELKERGKDVEELNETLNEVSKRYMETYRAENPEEKAQEMKGEAKQFREQFQAVAGEDAEEIQANAREKAQESQEGMQVVRNESWENVESAALKVFQNRINAAENKINAYEEAGFNISEMETTLNELKEMETELEEAYREQDREKIREVNTDIREKWLEIMKAQPEDRAQEYEEATERLEEISEETENLINRSREEGLDVAEAEASQEGIENGLERARKAINEENYEEAKQEIEQIRNQFEEYRENAGNLAQQLRDKMQAEGGR